MWPRSCVIVAGRASCSQQLVHVRSESLTGGYGDPNAELFTRWFQAGAYQPFFRGHAHHASARREPWTFEDSAPGTAATLRAIAMERYQLLAYWFVPAQPAVANNEFCCACTAAACLRLPTAPADCARRLRLPTAPNCG